MIVKKLLSIAILVALFAFMSAMAESQPKQTSTLDVEGYIGITTPNSAMINVTVPNANTLKWLVDENTETSSGSGVFNVQSGSYRIKNKSSMVKVRVKLTEFKKVNADATTVQPDLTLRLTGQLAINGNPDISSGHTGYTYNAVLAANDAIDDSGLDEWTFGFGGTYSNTLPLVAWEPLYDMVLSFELV